MNDESRKRLTEFLLGYKTDFDGNSHWESGYEDEYGQRIKILVPNRSFDSGDWESFGKLKEKLVERGWWYEFYGLSCKAWVDSDPTTDMVEYMLSPSRIELIDKFLKERGGGEKIV